MTTNKILSIIIPAYNMEKYLEKCCNSLIIKNNFNVLEVLIINDGSNDSTSLIAHKFAEKYSNVFRVIDKENGNYGSCINRGLAEVKGEFVKILDADDSFENDKFTDYVQYLLYLYKNSNDLVDLVITDRVDVDENGKEIGRTFFDFPINQICNMNEISHNKLHTLTHHSVTYRTAIFHKLQYVQTEKISYTDQEWTYLPILAVDKFIYYPHGIYIYLFGRIGQSMEYETCIKNMWMRIVIEKNMLNFYKNNKDKYPVVNQNCLEVLLCFSIEHIYAQYLISDRKRLDIKEIEDFDKYLLDNHSDLYNKTNDINITRHYPVKFINDWRKPQQKWKYYIIYIIYDLRSGINKFIRSILT